MDVTRHLWGHKYFEAEAYLVEHEASTVDIEFRFNPFGGCDHAGARFYACLGRFQFGVSFYDNRHWDYDNDRWYDYDSEVST